LEDDLHKQLQKELPPNSRQRAASKNQSHPKSNSKLGVMVMIDMGKNAIFNSTTQDGAQNEEHDSGEVILNKPIKKDKIMQALENIG
jgi:hypothetical protein